MPAPQPRESWPTDELLAAAVARYQAGMPGFRMPAAYGGGRDDGGGLTLGHVNRVGAVRPLPAVILASACGYRATPGVFELSREALDDVVQKLSPAEAATHLPHPNLWTWRELLASPAPKARFYAYFLAGPADHVDGPGAALFLAAARS